MVRFFPTYDEVRYVRLSKEKFEARLQAHIRTSNDDEKRSANTPLFIGKFERDQFNIILSTKSPGNFLPSIRGEIVESTDDMLLKLIYSMQYQTRRMLSFWTIITMALTVFFIALHNEWMYGTISFAFGVVNYLLSRENFKMQVRRSKRALDKLFPHL